MLKEIHEQPAVVGDTLRARLVNRWPGADRAAGASRRLRGRCAGSPRWPCGTAYLRRAGRQILVRAGRPGWRSISTSPRRFAYREPPLDRDGVTLVISQSGETLDTWRRCAMPRPGAEDPRHPETRRKARWGGESDGLLPTLARGRRIGVASTKASLPSWWWLPALAIARRGLAGCSIAGGRGGASRRMLGCRDGGRAACRMTVPSAPSRRGLAEARTCCFLGRGSAYPYRARRGALKTNTKSSPYHAEGYAPAR